MWKRFQLRLTARAQDQNLPGLDERLRVDGEGLVDAGDGLADAVPS